MQFPNVQKATEAVVDVLKTGVGIRMYSAYLRDISSNYILKCVLHGHPECVELVDDRFIDAINKYGMSARKYPVADSLFFKFQGPTPASLKETAKIVREVAERHGGTGFQLARTKEDAEALWSDRKNAHYAGLAIQPGAKGWPTDVW